MDYKGYKIININNQVFVSLWDDGMVFCISVDEAKQYIDYMYNRR